MRGRYIPEVLTTTERLAEGEIKRDKLRGMDTAFLRGELEQLRIGQKLCSGERLAVQRVEIGERIERIEAELVRRRRVY
ncbi:MAG: hypothetical protein LAT50_19445 [Ectothiorhodospiraceae bacterium]|nr:hypothetical protein [Ectothiorhodospiraceae bacterium]